MATRTPIPPGPPPRGYRPPGAPPIGSIGPLGSGHTADKTVVVQPGRHGVAVFVGIVALLVGIVIGYLLGDGGDGDGEAASGSVTTEATSVPTVTTTAPTSSPTSEGGGSGSVEPLGTLENPIPVGQAWILGIWQLRVTDVDTDATQTVLDASPRNPIPAADATYVLVEIELTLVDDQFVFAADFFPGLATADGTPLPDEFRPCGPLVPDDFFEEGRLLRDEPVSGNLCFEVPLDAVDGLLLTTDGIGGATTYFALD